MNMKRSPELKMKRAMEKKFREHVTRRRTCHFLGKRFYFQEPRAKGQKTKRNEQRRKIHFPRRAPHFFFLFGWATVRLPLLPALAQLYSHIARRMVQ